MALLLLLLLLFRLILNWKSLVLKVVKILWMEFPILNFGIIQWGVLQRCVLGNT